MTKKKSTQPFYGHKKFSIICKGCGAHVEKDRQSIYCSAKCFHQNKWKDPKFRESVTEGLNSYYLKPGVKQKHSKMIKKRHSLHPEQWRVPHPGILKHYNNPAHIYNNHTHQQEKNAKSWKTIREQGISLGKTYFSEMLGHLVRSTWEEKTCVFLKQQNIPYEYEPVTFKLKQGTTYTPDILLSRLGVWVEVKGRVDHVEKLAEFCRNQPLIVVTAKQHAKLFEYGCDIENLETLNCTLRRCCIDELAKAAN